MCRYSSDFIIKYRDSSISQDEKDKFDLHILNCEICRSLVALDKEFIEFLKDDNSTAKKISNIQVMSNIHLNKYNAGRGKAMAKLSKWKSNSIKIAAILFILCVVGLTFSQISSIREGFKTLALSIMDKQSRLNDKDSSYNTSGLDTTQTSKTPISTIKKMENINKTYEYIIDILATPQIALEIEPKIANEDPIHAAIDFINLKESKGELNINGKIENDDLEIVKKNDEEVIIKVNDVKVQIDRIYLRQLIGKDNVRIWSTVGYDPIWIGSIRTVYVKGSVSYFDKDKNMITIEVEKNIHKGNSALDSQDSPFTIGSKETFRLIEPTKVNLDNLKKIFIAVNKYSIENTNFYGGIIRYYERDGKWFDIYDTEVDYENIISR